MPARPKTTDAEIVQAARSLVDSNGRDGFSMSDVAAAVGIRAPSLYNRFRDRDSVVNAVEIQVCLELAEALTQAVVAGDPEATLMAQAKACRRFATKHPNSYSMLFDIRSARTEEGVSARTAALAPAIPALAALVGHEHTLAAARVWVPFMHGFISMEIAQAFRLGDGLDSAFENGIHTILRGLKQPALA